MPGAMRARMRCPSRSTQGVQFPRLLTGNELRSHIPTLFVNQCRHYRMAIATYPYPLCKTHQILCRLPVCIADNVRELPLCQSKTIVAVKVKNLKFRCLR